jgi:DNA mismatch endonuclease, patch repair protein
VSARSAEVISATMRKVRSWHTTPELTLRKALWAKGMRYRLHSKRLPGHPDIIFSRAKVALFVDGDFWHGNQWRKRGFKSLEEQFANAPNANYWIPKIKRNIDRDAEVTRILQEKGWDVIRVWESELKAS